MDTRTDDNRLRDVVTRINEICRASTLDVALRVGELVIAELYGGSITQWVKDGPRHWSFRRLAAHGELMMSASALCRAVAAYALCERLGGRASWRHLTASHLQEVLPLDDTSQERLLDAAEAERWTVVRLRAEVGRCRPAKRRPRRQRLLKIIDDLRALVAMLENESVDEIDSAVSHQELWEVVQVLHARLSAIYGPLEESSNARTDAQTERLLHSGVHRTR